METKNLIGPTPEGYWKLDDLLIHKNEYIQNWVYNKAFQRLWDNIEFLRHILVYQDTGCQQYRTPKYSKEQIFIGQNEIVTSTVINRNINYLWYNLSSLFEYFDPDCVVPQIPESEQYNWRQQTISTEYPVPTITPL
jgi:hypothetical protein